jgi:hypothetical protein
MKTGDECFRVNAGVSATATLALARDELRQSPDFRIVLRPRRNSK